MLLHRLAPRFDACPEQSPAGHLSASVLSVSMATAPHGKHAPPDNCINELSLLSRLWHELNDLPAHEVDAGAQHLLMRLCQLVQATHAQWHLEGMAASGARHHRANRQWPMGDAWSDATAAHAGRSLTHTVPIDASTQMVFHFYRQVGISAFVSQHMDLLCCALAGLHRWLHWLALSHGSSMATPPLPTHLRKVLLQLITGQSEKQIASTMDVSTNTTHQYITALYRLFGVRNRASLMSMWVSQHP